MDRSVSSFLRQHRDEILRTWETVVAAEARDVALLGLALRDDVPPLLDALADWLEGGEPPEHSPVAAQASRHVMQRLDHGLSLAQVFREYRILRETIIAAVLEAEADEQDRTGVAGDPDRMARIKGLARLNAGLDVVLAQSVVEFVAERERRAASERARAQRDVRGSEERYRTLFESMDQGFFVIDVLFDEHDRPVDLRYVEANAAATRLVGADYTGKRLREMDARYEAYWYELFGKVALTGQSVRMERYAEPDGRWYSFYVFRIGGPESRRVGNLFLDITKRKRAEEALARATERLSNVVNSIQDDFYVLDRDWRFTYASARFTSRIGKKPDDFVGNNIWEMFPAHLGTIFEENLRAAMERKETRRFDIPGKYTDAWYRMTVFPSAEGVTVLGTDITEAKRMEEALRAANANLVEADRRKTEFLAVLSHELRNPLAPIRNGIYLLERAAPDSEQATRAREVVRRQTEHLTRLVDDLLDVTRISHGKIPLERSRVDLREIVRKTTDDLHSMFTQSRIDLRVDYVTVGPMWIDADPTRIAQVLTNLLNNSMKFTLSGGTVRVSVAARDGVAELAVADDGVGMDPQRIEQMFEPFAQADHSLARTKGGLGLGLALVKSVVELHGGTVAARSDGPGRGAEFLVRVPLADAAAGSEKPRDLDAGAKARTILIIEDNLDAAQSLADILELHGHHVRVAHDGSSGIALAREVRPDVIICDIGLPDVDGYDVARALRTDGPLRDTRLIAISGYAQQEDRQRARNAGFDAHLAKPVELDELLAALDGPVLASRAGEAGE